MRPVRLAFSDQLGHFDPHNNFWLDQWRRFASVEVVSDLTQADVLMYSDWGQAHWRFQGPKIYHTGENMWPNFEECDLAFTSMHMPHEPRHVRLPIYFFYTQTPQALIKTAQYDPSLVLARKTGFCNFLVSNPRSPVRNAAFKALNAQKKVDSGGRHFNNLGFQVQDKLPFVSQYKFTLAFENSSTPGYTTEKLLEPMLVDSLPIYWGNPDVAQDFNPDSFIVAERFSSIDALVEHVLEVDANDALYMRYLREPWLPSNQLTEVFSHDRIKDALEAFWNAPPACSRARRCKPRKLREHVHQSAMARSWDSFKCRLESALWKLGHRT